MHSVNVEDIGLRSPLLAELQFVVCVISLRRLKLHGIKQQKVPKIHGLKKHLKNHSLACKKSSRFWNTKRTLM